MIKVSNTIKIGQNIVDDVFYLPDEIYVADKIPIIKWSYLYSKITSYTKLDKLKNYFTYLEDKYYPWMKTFLNVYENQYKAAIEILDYYLCGCQSVILAAQMQSGKTGVVRYLIHNILRTSNSFHIKSPDQIFFICGMNDNDLRSQAIREFKNLLPSKNILFSKQLQNYGAFETNVALVIIDESHYAAEKNSQVDKFLKRVSCYSPYILSVSATCMAEIATSKDNDRGIVYLKPGPDYYSVDELFERKLIYQSVDITNNMDGFAELVEDEYEFQMDRDLKKYNIVRLPSQWYYRDIIDCLSHMDINYLNYHSLIDISEEGHYHIDINDFNDMVKEPPEKFTIIWIYGSLRAGKQLNTTHIGFVHDTAKSKPDTIAQSLLGRIMGYGKKKYRVKCYTDIESANLIRTWFVNMFDETKIPKGSKCVLNGYSEKLTKWDMHPPLVVHLAPDMSAHYRYLKQIKGNRYEYKWELFDDLVRASDGNIRYQLEKIFSEYQPGPGGGLMILTEKNTTRSFNEHWTGNYNAYTRKKPIRGFNVSPDDKGNYFYVYVNLNIKSIHYGLVLVCYKEFIGKITGKKHIYLSRRSRFDT
jgi:hypothetical protein